MTKKIIAIALFLFSSVGFTQPGQPPSVNDPYKITFFNISDIHLAAGSKENTWRLSKDSAAIAKKTLKKVAAQKPELTLFSGDIIEGKFYGMFLIKAKLKKL
ncbi:MAG: hypothetical protein HY747_11075 [Elusimicrobia bacterium]|nr:hypothetical protein [Elusimicrobiota bacterium]